MSDPEKRLCSLSHGDWSAKFCPHCSVRHAETEAESLRAERDEALEALRVARNGFDRIEAQVVATVLHQDEAELWEMLERIRVLSRDGLHDARVILARYPTPSKGER